MGALLLICRVLLAAVFVVAGVAKLADLEGSRRAVGEFGIPGRFAGLLGGLLPVGELAVGVALLITPAARFGAVGAGVLLLAFIAAIGTALAGGREPDCHCFGQVHSAPAGPRTLARNLVLLGLVGFVAIGGWKHPGISATHWTGQLPAAWLVAIAAGLVSAGLIGVQVWFSLQLLAQNGRIIARIDQLEGAVAALTGRDLDVPFDEHEGPSELGAGLSGAGLPVGSPAPEFALLDLDGERYSLTSLRTGAPSLLLVFSDANCGPCQSLMPEVAAWQRQHAELLRTVVVAAGDPEVNRAKAQEHGLGLVLMQTEREVAELFEAVATPMALVVGADGLIESPTVGGVEAIRTLVELATRSPLAIRQVPSANGNGNAKGGAAPPDASRIGQPAPDLELRDLDENRVELKDLYGDRTVAIFWNPGCGFCQQMLPALKALELSSPEHTTQLVVISSGNPDQIRQDGLRSPVLLDPNAEAMRAFGAGGTPMGVVIENGRIASPIAAGGPAVLELIGVDRGDGPLA
jgi:peroxiredoxin/uncharacterized membrane protein YphA (DoxX/SURF4 family)